MPRTRAATNKKDDKQQTTKQIKSKQVKTVKGATSTKNENINPNQAKTKQIKPTTNTKVTIKSAKTTKTTTNQQPTKSKVLVKRTLKDKEEPPAKRKKTNSDQSSSTEDAPKDFKDVEKKWILSQYDREGRSHKNAKNLQKFTNVIRFS